MKHRFSTWRTRVVSLFLHVCGCAAALDGGALAQTWTTNNQLAHGTYPASALVQGKVGYYYSTIDGSQIYGILCVPPTSRPGPYPIAILNHGTNTVGVLPPYAGIEPTGLNGCLLMAEAGWLTAISTYRGEYIAANISQGSTNPAYVSGGQFELCNHEVDDVLTCSRR
jgi:hypothetical protein